MSSEISLLTRLSKKRKHMTGRRDRETQERKGKTEQERQGERGGQGLYIHNGWLTDGTQVNTEKQEELETWHTRAELQNKTGGNKTNNSNMTGGCSQPNKTFIYFH